MTGAVGADNWAGGLVELEEEEKNETFVANPALEENVTDAYLGRAGLKGGRGGGGEGSWGGGGEWGGEVKGKGGVVGGGWEGLKLVLGAGWAQGGGQGGHGDPNPGTWGDPNLGGAGWPW